MNDSSNAAPAPEVSLDAYYETLAGTFARPTSMLARQRLCQRKQRPDLSALPPNVEQIVHEADTMAQHLHDLALITLDNMLEFGRQTKKILVVLVVILAMQQRARMHAKRTKTESEGVPKKRSRPESSVEDAPDANTPDTAMDELAPEFSACKSEIVKLAISMFMPRNVHTPRIGKQRKLLGPSDIFKDHLKQLSSSINLELGDDFRPQVEMLMRMTVVRACLELSELLNDSRWSKTAFKLDPKQYVDAARKYSEDNQFVTSMPFVPLFMMYIEQPVDVREQLRVLGNNFDVDPVNTVRDVLGSVSRILETQLLSAATAGSSKQQQKLNQLWLNDHDACEVFVGPKHFPNDLRHKNLEHEGRHYAVVLYRDCLFDVRGVVMPPHLVPRNCNIVPESSETQESLMFTHLPWSSRLELVPFRAKIPLTQMTGSRISALTKDPSDMCGRRGATIFVSRKQHDSHLYEEFSFTINRNGTLESTVRH